MTHSIRQTFSKDVLNNYAVLKSYLHGEEDLAAIRALAENPDPGKALSEKKRNICVIFLSHLLAPFVGVLGVPPLATILNAIGLRHMGAFFDIASSHMIKESHDRINSWQFKGPILVPARNLPRMQVSDVYMCPDVPAHQIDPKIWSRTQPQPFSEFNSALYVLHLRVLFVCLRRGYILQIPAVFLRTIGLVVQVMMRVIPHDGWGYIPPDWDFRQSFDRFKKTYSWALKEEPVARLYNILEEINTILPMPDPVRIYKGDGVCRGAAEYFIHLCIQSRKWFDDPEKWLVSVSNQFRDGVPAQGVLMQVFFDTLPCVLGYSMTELNEYTISCSELDARSDTAIQKIETLPPGIYCTGVYRHAFVYIKLDNKASYLWNSECGLIRHTAEQLFDHVIKHYHKKGEQRSYISFVRYRAFRWLPFIADKT